MCISPSFISSLITAFHNIVRSFFVACLCFLFSQAAWADDPQGLMLYGRVHGGLPVAGGSQFPGESIDLRKGVLGWETLDVSLPGNGGLDIEVYRQFMSNERIERAMEDWSLSLPRITMGTNPGGSTKFDLPKSNYENNPGICADDNYNANTFYTNIGLFLAVLKLLDQQNLDIQGTAALVVGALLQWVWLTLATRTVDMPDLYTGLQLTIPGQGTKLLLRNINEQVTTGSVQRFVDGKAINARYVTTDNWLVECADDAKGKKNNFNAYSPDGKKYTFNEISKSIGDPVFMQQIGQYVWYPSKVEDRFGNSLTYSYLKDGYLCWGWDNYLAINAGLKNEIVPTCPVSAKLNKIKASDGREVTINYERPSAAVPQDQRTMNDHGGRRVSSIVASGRTWNYYYGKSYTTASNYLRKVELPDGTSWEFTKYPATKGGVPFMANDWARNFNWLRIVGPLSYQGDSVNLLNADGSKGGNSIINRILGLMESVKTPLGTLIKYDYTKYDADYFKDTTSKQNKVFSVKSRQISGPGIPTTTTTYDYTYNASLKQGETTIVMPPASNGDIPKKVYTFDLTPNADHFGLPIKTETFANDIPLQTTDIEYVTLGSIGEPSQIKESPRAHHVMRTTGKVTVTNEDGNVYQTEFRDFDKFGGPKTIIETGNSYRSYISNDTGVSVTPTKTTKATYFNNVDSWIVGIPEDQTIMANGGNSGNVKTDRTYNPNGTLKSQVQNNSTVDYTYLSKGDLNTVKWRTSGTAYTKTFDKYKNGMAQVEKHPGGISISRDLNGWGEVIKAINGRNISVSYGRDSLGRITSVDHQDYLGTSTEWNLDGNPRRRKDVSGSVEKITETDAMGNEISIASTDLITGITTYQTKAYDNYSNLVFESNKSFSPNPLTGVVYQYDALGRKVYIEDQNNNIVRNCYSTSCVPSGAPFAGWDLSGYIVNVETVELPSWGDESGSLTQNIVNINASIAYGDPQGAQVVGIFSKERETNDGKRYSATLFSRTLAGQPVSIAQGGGKVSERIVRGYEYYPNTTQVRYDDSPDIGRTELQYDESGNIRRKIVNGAVAVSFTYDYQNRILYEDYPNDKGTPDVSYAYDANGNLRWIDNGYSRTSYEFNTADLTEDVTFNVGGLTFFMDYEWNNDRTLQAITYPDGERVDFAPNGYGVPTSVGKYAQYATYHPAGYIESFEYGNGANYKIGVSDYNMPSDFEVRTPSNSLLAQEVYHHNFRKQVYAIDKRLGVGAAVFAESYKYYPSNALKSGVNQLGVVNYLYDQFGNLTSKQESGETLTMRIAA